LNKINEKTFKKQDDLFKNRNNRFSPERDDNNTLSFILSTLNWSEEHKTKQPLEEKNFNFNNSNQKTKRNNLKEESSLLNLKCQSI